LNPGAQKRNEIAGEGWLENGSKKKGRGGFRGKGERNSLKDQRGAGTNREAQGKGTFCHEIVGGPWEEKGESYN